MSVRAGEGNFMPHESRPRRRAIELSVVCAAVVALALPAQGRADDSSPPVSLDPMSMVGASLPADLLSDAAAPDEQPSLAAVAEAVQAAVDAAFAAGSIEADVPVIPPEPPLAKPEPATPENGSTTTVSPAIPPIPTTPAAPPTDSAPSVDATDALPAPSASVVPPATSFEVPAPSLPSLQAVSAPGQQISTTVPAAPPVAPRPAAQPAAQPAAAPGTAATAPVDAAPPDGTQYQNGNPTGINNDIPTVATTPPSASAIPEDPPPIAPGTWIWNWTWNCDNGPIGSGSPAPSPPAGAGTWIWNWQWNCGDAAPAPCTGCNTSISIRILSPGDDGDLAQTISSTTASIAQSISTTVQQTIHRAVPVLPPAPVSPLDNTLMPDPAPAAGTLPAALATAMTWFGIDPVPGAVDGATISPLDAFAEAAPEVAPHRFALDRVAASPPFVGHAEPFEPKASLRQPALRAPVPPRTQRAGSAGPAHPWKPLYRQAPPQRAPYGFAPDLTAGGTASGSSSTLGGFALLLGALLVGMPSTLKLLWVGGSTRPRRRATGRRERPG
jgi:hypothetical protein